MEIFRAREMGRGFLGFYLLIFIGGPFFRAMSRGDSPECFPVLNLRWFQLLNMLAAQFFNPDLVLNDFAW
ncbi:hypothetical protein AKJ64_02780 [candidate division MSBL1 archaeon SCGC-AAA259E17]|uniref:Uncharacterized protein n=1 Tax=candidate division MSBL1 archaeon SCGC-AAA259E17 TaxID=1698263 RepID=A0A133UEU0_9EURY|nr:hypothetical protein AKJ64_02780 [candidate division MSBL1 archaeon SCGC-AAA259E17]